MVPLTNRRRAGKASVLLLFALLVSSISLASCVKDNRSQGNKGASLPTSRDTFLPKSSSSIIPPNPTAAILSEGSPPQFPDGANQNQQVVDDTLAAPTTDVLRLEKEQQQRFKTMQATPDSSSPLTRNVFYTLLGVIVAFFTCVFAKYFPYVLTPKESRKVYQPAAFNYDPALSFFDNTAWTYATNYINMSLMLSIIASIAISAASSSSAALGLQRRACGLLLCYAASVGAGAIAHQNFLTLESRNTITFRLLWTLCVGTVTLAGGFMGACGSQVAKLSNSKYFISEWFWAGFGCFTTAVCAAGKMSFQRPACDIFVAGITQFPPTVYICLLSIFQMKGKVSAMARYLCVGGFVFLVPLLPLYAYLVYHTDWTLARINALCHFNLCVAWSTQGLALRHFSIATKNEKIEGIAGNQA